MLWRESAVDLTHTPHSLRHLQLPTPSSPPSLSPSQKRAHANRACPRNALTRSSPLAARTLQSKLALTTLARPAHASPALLPVVLRRVSAQMSASLSGTVNSGVDHALMLAQMDLQKANRRCELLQDEVSALRNTVASLEVDLARAMVATTGVPASAVVAAMHAKENLLLELGNLLLELGNSLGDQAAKRAQDAATSAVEIGRLRTALADAGIPAPAAAPCNRRKAVFDAVTCPRLEDVRRERERIDLLSVEAEERRLTRSVLLLLLMWHLCEWLLRRRLCSHFTSAVGEGKLHHGVALERITPHQVAFAHLAAASTFAVNFAITLTLRQWSRHPAKRSLAVCVCFINWVAFFTYAHDVHMTGCPFGPPIASAGGELFVPTRLLQWSATSPMLLFACSTLTGNSQQVRTLAARAVVCVLATIFFGAVERYAGSAVLSVLGFAASSIAFLATMLFARRLFRMVGQALSSAEDVASLGVLWRHTLTTWTLFPLARLCAIAGVFGPNTEELAMVFLDVVAKTAYNVPVIRMMVGTFTLVDAGGDGAPNLPCGGASCDAAQRERGRGRAGRRAGA